MIGKRLANYDVLSLLGAGGMGEVYRARDLKLKRDVAVKILPDEFSRDEDRVNRFQREAEVLASLNHPNIAAIYDFEQFEGTRFLVLEFVDGETLAERIQRGPIPVIETLEIAKKICEALEAAHDKGIVHRDLKPANVKITPEGEVKVLDFGLAKAIENSPAGVTLSNSPTMVGNTVGVVIIGTAAYMSPEQARGRAADQRSDVFALGCVLYEMLTRRQAFDGEDVADILASVMKTEVDLSLLPQSLNPKLRELIARCLAKDRKRRWYAIGDVRLELEAIMLDPTGVAPVAGNVAKQTIARPAKPVFWIASTLLMFAVVIGMAIGIGLFYRSRELPKAIAFSIEAPQGGEFSAGNSVPFASPVISPDGNRIAFTAQDRSGNTSLWTRSLDALTAQPLPGTEGAMLPFWSPDSRSIAFFAQGKLKRMDIAGAPPQTIAEAPTARGGTWNRDGVIVFAPANASPLFRVKASGGEAIRLETPIERPSGHRIPSFLPDGKHILYFVLADQPNKTGVYVGSVDSSESKRLLAADSAAVYSPTGHLLFVRQGTLLRQPFDLKKLEVSGEATPVVESVEVNTNSGAFSVSNSGVLVYRPRGGSENSVLTWVDRSGKAIETVGTPGAYLGIDVSRDGNRIAVHRHEGDGGDIWVLDSSHGPMSRITFDPTRENAAPIWSPDGSQIAFAIRDAKSRIYQKLADGSGGEDLLFESNLSSVPTSWSPDGKFIIFRLVDPQTQGDEWVFSVADKKAIPLIHELGTELRAQISPDGKWIAYDANPGGRAEIFVRAFPSGEGKRQLSLNGGFAPRWRGDGKELFYINAAMKVVSIKIEASASNLKFSVPTELFGSGMVATDHQGGSYLPYAVSPDGERFLIPRTSADAGSESNKRPIRVIFNWGATQ